MQVTVVCLAAAAVLIVLGLVGAAASVTLVGLFLVLSAGIYFIWPELSAGTVYRMDVWPLLEPLWLVPAFSGLVLIIEPNASPGELQSLGGIVGLIGMANYFLRPMYTKLYGLGTWLHRWSSGGE